MWPAVLPTCVYWPHLHSRSTWHKFAFSTLFCFVFFRQQGYKTIKLAHVWMGKTFVHKCFIPFCAKSIHNLKYFLKTNLFFTSSMVGLRENGVFLYTASKILAFTWLLSISIYLRFLNIYWYIDLCHDIILSIWIYLRFLNIYWYIDLYHDIISMHW